MIDNINRRSGKLGSELLDNRVWSVQTFDSIVAFHVNHNATVVTSVSTTNNGMDDLAEDFRHHENELLSFYRASVKHLNFLKYIYGLKRIASLIREFIGNHTGPINQLKKYFKSNILVKRKI